MPATLTPEFHNSLERTMERTMNRIAQLESQREQYLQNQIDNNPVTTNELSDQNNIINSLLGIIIVMLSIILFKLFR